MIKRFDINEIKSREVNSPFGISRSRLSKKHGKPYTSKEIKSELKELLKSEEYFKTESKFKSKESALNVKTLFSHLPK